MAQANPTVGDIAGNLALARRLRAQAADLGADLVVLPELFLVGYPPEDLVLKPAVCEHARLALEELTRDTADGGPALVVGAPWRDGGRLYNAAFVLGDGAVVGRVYKHALPNYGVFDEKRVFQPGPMPGPVRLPLRGGGSVRLGLMVCEDMWVEDVAEALGESGAEILVIPNGSPFEHGKQDVRLQLAVARVTETGLPLVYVNQVGGQDELVFDGGSFALDAERRLVAQAPGFVEDLTLLRWGRGADDRLAPLERGPIAPPLARPRDDLPGHGPGPARLCRQEPLSRRRARHVRRHRFGPLGGGRRRRAGAGPRPRGDDALALHLARQPGGRGRPARKGSASAWTRCRSRPRSTPSTTCWPRSSPTAHPTPPRRTSSRASAA